MLGAGGRVIIIGYDKTVHHAVREAVKRQHRAVLDRLPLGRSSGFVPIPMARYVALHLEANPGTDREEFTSRLTSASHPARYRSTAGIDHAAAFIPGQEVHHSERARRSNGPDLAFARSNVSSPG